MSGYSMRIDADAEHLAGMLSGKTVQRKHTLMVLCKWPLCGVEFACKLG